MLKPSAVGHFTQMEKGISLPHTVIIPLIQHFLKVTASKVFSLLDVSKFQIPVVWVVFLPPPSKSAYS